VGASERKKRKGTEDEKRRLGCLDSLRIRDNCKWVWRWREIDCTEADGHEDGEDKVEADQLRRAERTRKLGAGTQATCVNMNMGLQVSNGRKVRT
jgi:hypothetical protein